MTAPLDQRASRPTGDRTTARWAAAGVVGALLQVLGGILEAVDRVGAGEPGFRLRTSVIAVAYLLLLGTLMALDRSGVLGRSRVGRIGLAASATGWVLSAVAQLVLPVDVDLAEKVLFPVATVLIGVGMILAGVRIIRARRWTGPRRLLGLICGLYPFAVMFPTFVATGGPNFLVLAGWGACWLALGLALWAGPGDFVSGESAAGPGQM